jgi:hypothetical protein
MHALTRMKITGIGVTLSLLAGSSVALADCFSQTIAQETYYSCSGVLTIVPAERTGAAEGGKGSPRDTGTEPTPKRFSGAGVVPAQGTGNGPP